MMKDNPDMNTSDASRQITYSWNLMTDQEKRKYKEKERADEQRYQDELKIFLEKSQAEGWNIDGTAKAQPFKMWEGG